MAKPLFFRVASRGERHDGGVQVGHRKVVTGIVKYDLWVESGIVETNLQMDVADNSL